MLSPLMSLMMICVISCNFPIAAAQQNNTSFLTYTNTELGFTIRYPWNWTVNASDTINGHKVTSFTSPDRVGVVFVQIENATRGEIAVYNLNDAAKTNTIRTHLTPSEDLIIIIDIIQVSYKNPKLYEKLRKRVLHELKNTKISSHLYNSSSM